MPWLGKALGLMERACEGAARPRAAANAGSWAAQPRTASSTTCAATASPRPSPSSRVSADAGDWLHWAGNSRQLYWSQGPNLHVQNLAGAGDFAGGKPAPAPVAAQLGFGAAQTKPTGRIALTGARIVTMAGADGGIIDNGAIVIEGDRIAAIGPRAQVVVPAGAKVIDASARTAFDLGTPVRH